MDPLRPVILQQLGSTGKEAMHNSSPFLLLAEVHLKLGSVVLVFSTLGISRSCAAILAYLMHWQEQTLKVCIPWFRFGPQPLPGGGVRASLGRNRAPRQCQGLRDERGKGQGGELQVQGFTQHTIPKGKVSTVQARGLRLGSTFCVSSTTISLFTSICLWFSRGGACWLLLGVLELQCWQGLSRHPLLQFLYP